MSLGTPVYACPEANLEPADYLVDGMSGESKTIGSLHTLVEPIKTVIDTAWFVRPTAIIHLGMLLLLEAKWSVIDFEHILKSVGVASVAAYTLRVPFLLVSPASPLAIPATVRGVQALMSEDQVRPDQWIIRANGVFGPKVANRVKGWVRSENLTVDDKRKVNPIFQPGFDKILTTLIEVIKMGTIGNGGTITVGGPQTTWYDFFLDANITNVTPWADDPLSKHFVREGLFEWPDSVDRHGSTKPYPEAHKFLREWYSQVHN